MDTADGGARFDGPGHLKVVGESHYQEVLARLSGAPLEGDHAFDCFAVLVLEPDNAHDPKAVMVQVDGECVGYLPRLTARRIRATLLEMGAQGQPAICSAFIGRLESTGNPNLGISLLVSAEDALLGEAGGVT